jgi:hypothetical protein
VADLAVHIHQFVPSAAGDELEQRIALLKSRDHAAMLGGSATDEYATNLACDAHEVAGEWVYAPASVAQLSLAATLARSLVNASFAAEYLTTGVLPQ